MMRRLLTLIVLLLATPVFATVSDGETIRQSFTTNGSTTTFTFTFKCNSSDDVFVYSPVILTGLPIEPLVEDTDYTIAPTGGSYLNGGVVTIDPALEAIVALRIVRRIKQSQETSAGAITPATIVAALDKLTRQVQDAEDRKKRSLHIPDSDSVAFDMTIPDAITRGGKNLGFDANGNITITDSSGTFTSINAFWDDIITKSPWADVRAFGAVGNGTADDTAALQAAIDATTAYGTVVLPLGTYLFSQLKFYNPIVFTGLGSVAARWNDEVAGVTLLHDESTNPAIIIGGTSDSVIAESGFNIAEGITLANFLLLPQGTTANVGILIDGSTTISGSRGPARGIRFENVTVRTFGSNNIKFLGNVFDVRFKGGGSRANLADGVVTETATSEGSDSPSQLHFYDFYSQAQTGDWNFNGKGIHLYGGGVGFGNGFLAGSACSVFGTHFEGLAGDPASVGLQIIGQYGNFIMPNIATYKTGIIIGDGTNTVVRKYFINTTVGGATLGVQITDGATRDGSGVVFFDADVTTDIQDDRADTDGVFNEFHFLYDRRTLKNIKSLDNTGTPSVGDLMAGGTIFLTGGTTTITDFDEGYPGQVITVIAEHSIIITDGTNILLTGSTDFEMAATDTLTLVQKADGNWYETGRGYAGSDPLTLTNTVEINSAQMKTMAASPVELVAAQGADTLVEFVSAVIVYNSAATDYTVQADENMAVRYENGAGTIVSLTVESDSLIKEASSDGVRIVHPIATFQDTDIVGLINKSLVLDNVGSGEWDDGAGTMTVKTTYRVHTLGL